MVAKVEPLSDVLLQEFLIRAEQDGNFITGCELGLERALGVARGLALGGWRVVVESTDSFIADQVKYEVYSESVS